MTKSDLLPGYSLAAVEKLKRRQLKGSEFVMHVAIKCAFNNPSQGSHFETTHGVI